MFCYLYVYSWNNCIFILHIFVIQDIFNLEKINKTTPGKKYMNIVRYSWSLSAFSMLNYHNVRYSWSLIWPQFMWLGLFLCLNLTKFGCLLQEQVFSENDAFFAWTFAKRHPLWQTLLSFFWPVLTLAICLFPVYPHRCKLLILYSCAGILFLILSVLLSKFFFPLIVDFFFC